MHSAHIVFSFLKILWTSTCWLYMHEKLCTGEMFCNIIRTSVVLLLQWDLSGVVIKDWFLEDRNKIKDLMSEDDLDEDRDEDFEDKDKH